MLRVICKLQPLLPLTLRPENRKDQSIHLDTIPPTRKTEWLAPAAAYFGLVFAAGFLLGALRVPFLVPRIGVRLAELLEIPVMLVAITWSARFVVRRFALPAAPSIRLRVGGLALAFLVAAELLLAYALQGISPADYIASRDPVSGPVYCASLVVFALMPAFVLRTALGILVLLGGGMLFSGLGHSAEKPSSSDPSTVFVEVQADGQHCVVRKSVLPCAEVLARLRQVLKLAPGTWVRFKAGRATPFDALKKVMDDISHSEYTTSLAYVRPPVKATDSVSASAGTGSPSSP
jgi:hypothetical protein